MSDPGAAKPGPAVLFHIGWPKTGTTSFQNWLVCNEDLLESQGILYPRTGRWPEGAHHDLALSLRPIVGHKTSDAAGSLWKRLANEIQEKNRLKPYRLILITSELMPLLYDYPAALALLEPLSSGMSLLAVVREQVSALISLHRQLVCDPAVHITSSAAEFFLQEKNQLLYFDRLEGYKNAYPWQSITVLEYGPDIVEKLLRAAGITAAAKPSVRANASPPFFAAEIIRRLNQVEMPPEARQRLNARVLRDPPSQALLIPPLSDDEIASIRDFYGPSNKKLFLEYGIDLEKQGVLSAGRML